VENNCRKMAFMIKNLQSTSLRGNSPTAANAEEKRRMKVSSKNLSVNLDLLIPETALAIESWARDKSVPLLHSTMKGLGHELIHHGYFMCSTAGGR